MTSSKIVDAYVGEMMAERLSKHTHRDHEFAAAMGNWQRPANAPRYDLEKRNKLVRWHSTMDGVIDVELFLKSLQPHDRQIAAKIARWCAEEFYDKFATDKTLGAFRLNFFRRLDACGF